MSRQAHKVGPTSLAARSGATKSFDHQEDSPPSTNVQEGNRNSPSSGMEWWTPSLQKALDYLANPRLDEFRVRVTNLVGHEAYEPTGDVPTLEQHARVVGIDAIYTLISPGGYEIPIRNNGLAMHESHLELSHAEQ